MSVSEVGGGSPPAPSEPFTGQRAGARASNIGPVCARERAACASVRAWVCACACARAREWACASGRVRECVRGARCTHNTRARARTVVRESVRARGCAFACARARCCVRCARARAIACASEVAVGPGRI